MGEPAPFWTLPEPVLLASLDAGRQGLAEVEAAHRLAEEGPNELAPPRRLETLKGLVRVLASPLVLVLLVASAVSAAVGEPTSAVIIVVMVGIGVALDVTQSFRSQAAAGRLREQVAETATVVRNGAPREVPVRAVVRGDLVRLAAGDLVPADARLLTARNLFVNEAALTGESLPLEKRPAPLGDPSADLAQAASAVFRGSSVTSGAGTAVVVRTGAATEFGRVVAVLAARPTETEFERGTRRFGILVVEVIVALVLFVFLVNAVLRRDTLEAFLFAVALAVGLTPELLPMIVGITLASGAVRMAERRVVVKRLAAIENFGSMDVLCSDKTGTVTAGEMRVHRAVDGRGRDDPRVLATAALNSALQTGPPNPMDAAILAGAPPAPAAHGVAEVPFDFTRRRVSVVVGDAGRRRLVTKGAPESVLAICTRLAAGAADAPLDGASRAGSEGVFRRLSADGYRVLAVASRTVDLQPGYGVADERDLTLDGFVAFLDPPLPGVGETLAALRADGVEVKVLTGDNELVTARVCEAVGLGTGTIVLGHEVDTMSDAALGAVAERTAVFARVSPTQKNRIVLALRSRGHVVGFVGDGINDAPAIRSADVGISVVGAAGVARDAADIILLEKRLTALHDGVVEGRRSFGNIMKYVLMGMSSNFGNMLSMAAASLVLPFLPMLPTQILLNNLLYDLSQTAIPSDRVDDRYLVKPRRWNVALIRRYMLVLGPVSSLFDLATFWMMLRLFRADATLFRTGWFMESLATQTLVIFVIRTAGRPWASRPSAGLAAGVGAGLAAGVILPYTPLALWLGFAPLPPLFLAGLAVMVVSYLALVEAVKGRLHRP